MRSFSSFALTWVALALGAGCGGTPHGSPGNPGAAGAKSATVASVELFPVNRSEARGTLRFVATDAGLSLRGRVSGLLAGKYGFGVHDGADCGPGGSTAGPYFEGGNRLAPLGHLEDLFIEKVDGVNVTRVETHLKLSGPYSIIGKTLVIEAWPTDPKVDPKTVPMVACGVIHAG